MQPQITGALQAALTAAAFAPAERAFLRISGPDATRWLNGMVTNCIQALQPGEGNYNFFLNAQGRIQGDGTLYREPSSSDAAFLLETDPAQLDPLHQLLDKFIIMDDVELTPGLAFDGPAPSTSPFGLALLGPSASDLISGLLTSEGSDKSLPIPLPGTLTWASFQAHPVVVLASAAPGIPHFEIWSANQAAHDELLHTLGLEHVPQLSPDTLEALRILEARPRYGTDIRNTDTAKDLPQETNQPHALHFAKGCYLGQEIVERIRSRGQVHRLFTPFRLEGTLPNTLPAPLTAKGKPAGELTSAIDIPTTQGPVTLALGYARREFLDTRAPLTYPGGSAHPRSLDDLS